MPTNTRISVSLNPEAGTNFSPGLITIFVFPYLIFAGTRSGASPMQVRGKSGSIGYLEGSTYGFPTVYLSSIYGVAMEKMRKFHASNACVFPEKSINNESSM
jgi:hypothetical protein